MKTWQFITIIVLVLWSLWLSTFSYLTLSNRIEELNSKTSVSKNNDNKYHIDEKEFKRLMYTIEEDSHFCRLWIQAHRDEFESWTTDYTKLFLNTFKL
jgi:hypothetical protein